MTDNIQIQVKRISFIFAVWALGYTIIDTCLWENYRINLTEIVTPILLWTVALIITLGITQRIFYHWLRRSKIVFASPTTKESPKSESAAVPLPDEKISETHSSLDSYELRQKDIEKKNAERNLDIMREIREYVIYATAAYLTKESLTLFLENIEHLACNREDLYQPIRSNTDNPLKSPSLRHLAWNIGERLAIPLNQRATFIKASFPEELKNATIKYLSLNLRDEVPSQIPIDVPDKGDYRFKCLMEEA